MDIQKLTQSTKWTSLIRILGILLIAVIIFWAGTAVGYKKAQFSDQLGNRYFQAFDRPFDGRGDRPRGMDMMGIPDIDRIPGGHGAAGKVLSVNLPTIVVSDPQGLEKIIRIADDTLIRTARESVSSTTVKTDDFIVVIGTPDQNGEITAKLIRIMPAIPLQGSSTTMPYRTI